LTSSLHAQEQEEAAKRDKQALYKKEKKPKNWENKKHTARDLSLFPWDCKNQPNIRPREKVRRKLLRQANKDGVPKDKD